MGGEGEVRMFVCMGGKWKEWVGGKGSVGGLVGEGVVGGCVWIWMIIAAGGGPCLIVNLPSSPLEASCSLESIKISHPHSPVRS